MWRIILTAVGLVIGLESEALAISKICLAGASPKPTITVTPSPTVTITMTPLPGQTLTPTPFRTPTQTPTKTKTPTPTRSKTPTPLRTATFTPSPKPTSTPLPICDPNIDPLGGLWTSRWGFWNPDVFEPALFNNNCHFITGKDGLITSNTLSAVILEWWKSEPTTSLRSVEITFKIPAAFYNAFNHMGFFAAYRKPLPSDVLPDINQFGRIGAAVRKNPITPSIVLLSVEFQKWTDNLNAMGHPDGCDGTTNPLFADVPISGGLIPDHWYRVRAQISQRLDGGLNIVANLRDAETPGLPLVAATSYSAPSSCTPPWYFGSENRWAVGIQDNGSPTKARLDNFLGYPSIP